MTYYIFDIYYHYIFITHITFITHIIILCACVRVHYSNISIRSLSPRYKIHVTRLPVNFNLEPCITRVFSTSPVYLCCITGILTTRQLSLSLRASIKIESIAHIHVSVNRITAS